MYKKIQGRIYIGDKIFRFAEIFLEMCYKGNKNEKKGIKLNFNWINTRGNNY